MIINSVDEMTKLGEKIALHLKVGDVICLNGQLGVGKSVLARSIIRAIAQDENLEVPSPSFTLVQDYEFGECRIMHMDAYRLSTSDELWELGLPDCFENQITLIEWPDRLGELTPKRRIDIDICDEGGDVRKIKLNYHGAWVWKL